MAAAAVLLGLGRARGLEAVVGEAMSLVTRDLAAANPLRPSTNLGGSSVVTMSMTQRAPAAHFGVARGGALVAGPALCK